MEKIEQILVFGNVTITPPARRLLLRHNVDTVFLTRDGRYLGRYFSNESKNFFLRKKQFLRLDDKQFGIDLCREIVRGKLTSMMTLLMRIKRTKKLPELARNANDIKVLFSSIDKADSIESLRGYEGKGSAVYFGCLHKGLVNDFGFRRRVRRPPTDPVNAVLSLLYTLLFNRVYAAIRIANLDPYPAFLHSPDYGRYALVMDLMEEFRVIIADTLALSLFNLKILQQKDFIVEKMAAFDRANENQETEQPDVTLDPYGVMADTAAQEIFDVPPQKMSCPEGDVLEGGDGKPPVRLTKEAFRRVMENFERKLTTEIYYEPYDRKISYGEAIVAQARQYRKAIEGEAGGYRALVLK